MSLISANMRLGRLRDQRRALDLSHAGLFTASPEQCPLECPMAKPRHTDRLIAENRKARFDYFIEERFEAGLALQGWEVKAMRAGRAQLAEATCTCATAKRSCSGRTSRRCTTASTHVRRGPGAHAQAPAQRTASCSA